MVRPARPLAATALLLCGAGLLALTTWPRIEPPPSVAPAATPPNSVPQAAAPAAAASRRELAPDPPAAPVSPPSLVVCGDIDALRHVRELCTHLTAEPRLEPMTVALAVARVRRGEAHAAVVCAPPGSPPDAPGLVHESLGLFAPILVAAPTAVARDLTRGEVEALCRGPAAGAGDSAREARIALVGVPPPRASGWPRLRRARLELLADPQRIWQRVCTADESALGLLSLATLPPGARAVRVEGVVPDAWSVRERRYPYGYEVYLVHASPGADRLDALLRLLASPPGQALLRRDLVP